MKFLFLRVFTLWNWILMNYKWVKEINWHHQIGVNKILTNLSRHRENYQNTQFLHMLSNMFLKRPLTQTLRYHNPACIFSRNNMAKKVFVLFTPPAIPKKNLILISVILEDLFIFLSLVSVTFALLSTWFGSEYHW